jgi:hypothetical protein
VSDVHVKCEQLQLSLCVVSSEGLRCVFVWTGIMQGRTRTEQHTCRATSSSDPGWRTAWQLIRQCGSPVHDCHFLYGSCGAIVDLAQRISSKTKSRIKTKMSTAMQQLDHESARLGQQSPICQVGMAVPSFCLITQPTFFMPVCSLPPTLSATVSTSSSISTCSSSSRPMSLAC